MEENVALDATKQKKFVKSIKGIKKLIKKNESEKPADEGTITLKKEKRKRKRPDRGLVYLSHIPHGFYEHQMTEYFKQFGVVTNARVIRSKRTGNSKGYAFVEFKEPTVAEIVAETMNNYLMGKRLIKAAYIPPEKQKARAFRKHWSRDNNPGRNARLAQRKAFNENKDEKGDLRRARKILSNLNKTKKKLSEMGINYDFFTPVDIPEALQGLQIQRESNDIKDQQEAKKGKKENSETKIKKQPVKSEKDIHTDKNKKQLESKKTKVVKNEDEKPDVKKQKKELPVINKRDQKQKQQKLKDAGVKPPENFIQVQEDDDDDSSVDFDSDEYEKMLQDDGSDSADSGDESDEEASDDESDDNNDSEDEEIIPPPPKSKGKGRIVPQDSSEQSKKEVNKQKGNTSEVAKRNAPQKPPVIAKKAKFEKQTQQPLKKQFKKKK